MVQNSLIIIFVLLLGQLKAQTDSIISVSSQKTAETYISIMEGDSINIPDITPNNCCGGTMYVQYKGKEVARIDSNDNMRIIDTIATIKAFNKVIRFMAKQEEQLYKDKYCYHHTVLPTHNKKIASKINRHDISIPYHRYCYFTHGNWDPPKGCMPHKNWNDSAICKVIERNMYCYAFILHLATFGQDTDRWEDTTYFTSIKDWVKYYHQPFSFEGGINGKPFEYTGYYEKEIKIVRKPHWMK